MTNPDCTCTPLIPELCPVCEAVQERNFTHGEDEIATLKAQNADLLAALGACTGLLSALHPYFVKMQVDGVTTAVSPKAVLQRIDELTEAARAAIASVKGTTT